MTQQYAPGPTLAEFLLARYDEIEALAADAARFVGGSFGPYSVGAQAHVVRELWRHADHWTPARVLADVEAKRKIVAWWQVRIERYEGSNAHLHLAWLALPYADHPDWREEWRP